MNLLFFSKLRVIEPLAALALRVWLAQEFMLAGYIKLGGGFSAPEWFGGLDFPFPVNLFPADINWFIAGLSEILLGLLLLLGLYGRLAAAGLLFITWVAVYSVHFDLGWAGWNQIESDSGLGFKVPLMMGLMLLVLFLSGAGRWSVDHWWRKRTGMPTV